jgi:glycosyltransferase involved in cell wall biosynthesis
MSIAQIPILGVVMPVGNLAVDQENISRILTMNSTLEILTILAIDNQPKAEVETLERFISKSGFRHVIVTTGIWNSPGTARNQGLYHCKTQWVSFWDSDDMPDGYRIKKAVMLLNGSKYDAAMGSFQRDIDGVIQPEMVEAKDFELDPIEQRVIADPGVWRFIFRKDFIKGICFPSLSSGEDQVFLQRFFSLNPKIRLIEESIYTYVCGGQTQLTRSKKVADHNILSATIGLGEFSFCNSKSRRLFGTLIFKQIMSVIKHGNVKQKMIGMHLVLRGFKVIGVSNSIHYIRRVIKISLAR